MKEKIEKARKLAIEKWGEEKYQRVKRFFDEADKNEDYMDAVDAFLKDNEMNSMAFLLLATID